MFRLQGTIALIFLLTSPLGWAEIYKWVDANGNVRFSDKPPPGQTPKTAQQVQLPDRQPSAKRSVAKPAPGPTRRAMLETIRYRIADAELDREIGKEYYGRSYAGTTFDKLSSATGACNSDGRAMDVSVPEQTLQYGMGEFQRAFHGLLDDHGYEVVKTNSVFAAQAATTPEISIAALVRKAYFVRCRGGNLSFNKTDLTIEWQVFDNLSREVVFTLESSGSDDQYNGPPVKRGTVHSFKNAMLDAAQALLANEDFYAAVAASANISPSLPAAQPVSFEYGSDSDTFLDKSHLLEQGTVTIRTPGGHGSGFFISAEGHVLTNQHVVSGSDRVLVITTNAEEYAQVIHVDAARDVALLQVESAYAAQPLRVSQRQPRLGEQIYVLGTPLDESLSFSVTRGIVSGRRSLRGQPLIQTDAAVNPGNSGGPVVDEFGNVIAISVSGIFSESGGSLNTNFLIPIDDALTKMGIGPSA